MKFVPMFMLLAAFALSACSTTATDEKAIYAGAKISDPLKIPPDLSQPEYESGSVSAITSYLGYEKSLHAGTNGQVLTNYLGMSFERVGTQFWLNVNDSAIQVWRSLHGFFGQMGFKIINEQPELGIMQTNWQVNQSTTATNWFTRKIGNLMSAEKMDSYRAHIEYDSQNKITRVFILHQGVMQVNIDDFNTGSMKTEWQLQPPNPELEVEMLMRFMEYRGMGKKEAKKEIAQAKPVEQAVLKSEGDSYVLQYNDTFPRVWRLVGIALDRMGVLVEDRNYSAGVFYITLSDSFTLDDKSGFFESSNKPSKQKYLITLQDKGSYTLISVKARGEAGKDLPAVTKKILSEIKINLL